MNKQKKSFVTCYDKNCEEIAQLLGTLISDNPSMCNIERKLEIFKRERDITSNEYVLTIGPKSSKTNQKAFNDTYNKYGIHIGIRGHKSWISCENFHWDKRTLAEFHKELIKLLDDLDMCTDNIDETIAENIKKVKETKSLSSVQGYSELQTIVLTSLVAIKIAYGRMRLISLWNSINDFFKASRRRKEQYKLAIVLFYHKYINDFLRLSDSEENIEKEKDNF